MSLDALLNLGVRDGKHTIHKVRESVVFGRRFGFHAAIVTHLAGSEV